MAPGKFRGRMAMMAGVLVVVAAAFGCQQDRPTEPDLALQAKSAACDDAGLGRLHHIVVIYLENHSFDNLYGEFPGANGLANAAGTTTQVDASGTRFANLPVNAGSPIGTRRPTISRRRSIWVRITGTREADNCEPQRHRGTDRSLNVRSSALQSTNNGFVVERADIGSLAELSAPLHLCGAQLPFACLL